MRARICSKLGREKQIHLRMGEGHARSSHIFFIFLFVIQSFHGVLDVLCRLGAKVVSERFWHLGLLLTYFRIKIQGCGEMLNRVGLVVQHFV